MSTRWWWSTSTSTARRRDAAGWAWRRVRCSSAWWASAIESGFLDGVGFLFGTSLQSLTTTCVCLCVCVRICMN